MNSCVMCWYETGVHHTGNFMKDGDSLCSRHLNKTKPESKKKDDKLKWSDDK